MDKIFFILLAGILAAQAQPGFDPPTYDHGVIVGPRGVYHGNALGLTNLQSDSADMVRYISRTRPAITNNSFGPWTPGTTTGGIQEAWDSVTKPTNAGPVARGATLYFSDEYHYFTNVLVFSNYWPMAITIKGKNLLSTKMVYAGPTNIVRTIHFRGPATPRSSSLNLPVHLTVTDMGFTSITNSTNILVHVQNMSDASFVRCNFTGWQVMTNQVEGAGVSTDAASVGGVTGADLVGLVFTDGPDHSTKLDHVYFSGLATALDTAADHVKATDLSFAHIGVFTNRWPASSKYSLGACVIRTDGLHSAWYDLHCYSAKSGFISLSTTESPLLDHIEFESVQNPLGALASSERTPVVRDVYVYGTPALGTWPYIYTVSNSPNYGVTANIHSNSTMYGVDANAAATGSGASKVWNVRLGDADRFSVDYLGAVVGGRLDVVDTLTGNTTFFTGTGLLVGDADFSHSIELGSTTGILTASHGVSAPIITVGTPTITSGAGAPAAAEPNGSIYMRTDGGASTTLYIRHSGTWLAK